MGPSYTLCVFYMVSPGRSAWLDRQAIPPSPAMPPCATSHTAHCNQNPGVRAPGFLAHNLHPLAIPNSIQSPWSLDRIEQ